VSELLDRVAGAPITWGVCEVPGWGFQMERDRVLAEIAAVGLRATELGPEGFFPSDPGEAGTVLRRHGLTLVGGFVPAVLHVRDRLPQELDKVRRAADLLSANGCAVLVLAADSAGQGYEEAERLSPNQWRTLVGALDRVTGLARERGLAVALHPHHGTVIEGPDDVDELLTRCSVSLCLDTGHLLVGGADPLRVARSASDRIAHVHLKDVDAELAEGVRTGKAGYHEAVGRGMYRPLGRGDADIAEIVASLERAGYDGWYVIEQDTVLPERPPEGEGPVRDAAASVDFLRELAPGLARGEAGRPARVGRSLDGVAQEREEVGR
jgi:inosose dehydratase